MASLSYLWSNRAKFPIKSMKFYRAWGKRLFSLPELLKRNNRRISLVRKGAKIDHLAEIGEITVSGHPKFLTINSLSSLGKVVFRLTEKVTIGNNVCISDDVKIITGSHDVFDPKWPTKRYPIVINDYVWVGMGAMILSGVELGRGCVVGAGAVVSRSVAPGEIVIGNPAKPISKKRLLEFDYNPCEFIAANRAWLIG